MDELSVPYSISNFRFQIPDFTIHKSPIRNRFTDVPNLRLSSAEPRPPAVFHSKPLSFESRHSSHPQLRSHPLLQPQLLLRQAIRQQSQPEQHQPFRPPLILLPLPPQPYQPLRSRQPHPPKPLKFPQNRPVSHPSS